MAAASGDVNVAPCDVGNVAPPSPPAISLISPSLEEPLAEPLTKGYLEAAVAQVSVISQHTASMPSCTWSFRTPGEPLTSRTASLDTGCNVNLMSYRAFVRDFGLMGPRAKTYSIKPFRVGLADGKASTHTCTAVQNAEFILVDAVYDASFLVIRDLAQDYIMGMPWLIRYNVRIFSEDSNFAIGVPKSSWISDKPYRSAQLIPMHIKVKKLNFIVENDPVKS
jgi:hypothetical protein